MIRSYGESPLPSTIAAVAAGSPPTDCSQRASCAIPTALVPGSAPLAAASSLSSSSAIRLSLGPSIAATVAASVGDSCVQSGAAIAAGPPSAIGRASARTRTCARTSAAPKSERTYSIGSGTAASSTSAASPSGCVPMTTIVAPSRARSSVDALVAAPVRASTRTRTPEPAGMPETLTGAPICAPGSTCKCTALSSSAAADTGAA